jgi:single-strand DNA-binding protein
MQLITISGNIGKDAELRRTQSGDAICSFSVGVKNGFGRDATSNWYRVSVWGKRGETLQPMLYKGMKVVVVGELTIGEYNGKPQYDVRANEVEFTPRKDQQGNQQSSRDDSDLDDQVPF